ncbi:hypothetical protein J6590_074851 [Homalodisca vitripennis]|nr:hypothetical protein J6590_074851 [Homalodisca vitripennis]
MICGTCCCGTNSSNWSTVNSMLGASNSRYWAYVSLTSGENINEISPSNVCINEQPAPHNKALLGRVRRLVKARRIHFARFFNGKILIKPTEDADTIRVLQVEDMDHYK